MLKCHTYFDHATNEAFASTGQDNVQSHVFVLNASPALEKNIYRHAWNYTILYARAFDLPLTAND